MMHKNKSLIDLLKNLWTILGKRSQIQFIYLVVLMLLASSVEMISIGAVVPFIGILTQPEKVYNNPNMQMFLSFLSINRPDDLLLPITILFSISAMCAGGLRLVLLKANTTYSFSVGADFSNEVFRRSIYQPYDIHINRNSSEIINGITGKVSMLIGSILVPLLNLISSIILIVAILTALIAVNASIAIVAGSILGGLYWLTAIYFRKSLKENSECVARESTLLVKALQESLGGIRDVLLDGTQEVFCSIYSNSDRLLRLAQARTSVVGGSPRYIMEMLGIITIACLALSMSETNGGILDNLPVLGAIALGAQKLLPLLQQGYNSWTTIAGSESSLRDALQLFNQSLPAYVICPHATTLAFEKEISLSDIGFSYANNGLWALRNISFIVPKGSRVGIAGKTGSGKSTLTDIIMSLLIPTEGIISVDKTPITIDNLRAWQDHIAHVPQSIFLADSTIEENIAFGVSRDKIDRERVKLSAQKAQVADVIESWPLKYNTIVGERGVRLSGGQRQRIGIARALYKSADVIIFDEATSALDIDTEAAVMDAVENLDEDLTIFIIAHRLSTLRKCDFIVYLEDNKQCKITSYQELLK